mmetsp:Transcript_26387/g.57310  ORF Transcript_26387/g.57310 Transcript_26387/m.57310 type:complete len:233 (+) Transcript_26387:633-1331(+)
MRNPVLLRRMKTLLTAILTLSGTLTSGSSCGSTCGPFEAFPPFALLLLGSLNILLASSNSAAFSCFTPTLPDGSAARLLKESPPPAIFFSFSTFEPGFGLPEVVAGLVTCGCSGSSAGALFKLSKMADRFSRNSSSLLCHCLQTSVVIASKRRKHLPTKRSRREICLRNFCSLKTIASLLLSVSRNERISSAPLSLHRFCRATKIFQRLQTCKARRLLLLLRMIRSRNLHQR